MYAELLTSVIKNLIDNKLAQELYQMINASDA